MRGHENIVELYDYTENQDEFVLLMEYCNDASYFEDKIENVSPPYTIKSGIHTYTLKEFQKSYKI